MENWLATDPAQSQRKPRHFWKSRTFVLPAAYRPIHLLLRSAVSDDTAFVAFAARPGAIVYVVNKIGGDPLTYLAAKMPTHSRILTGLALGSEKSEILYLRRVSGDERLLEALARPGSRYQLLCNVLEGAHLSTTSGYKAAIRKRFAEVYDELWEFDAGIKEGEWWRAMMLRARVAVQPVMVVI